MTALENDNDRRFRILAAPLQGLTECAWRRFHRDLAGGAVDAYFTPFLRVERGEVRRRAMRDLQSPLNDGVPLVAQIIARDLDEFRLLCDAVGEAGYGIIDLNMGCPFPPQVSHGRGAGMIANLPLLDALAEEMSTRFSHLRFSVKMRLGVESPDEWRRSVAAINALPLTHITLHARTARQQYAGQLAMDEFADFMQSAAHPVVFNGDVVSPANIAMLRQKFPALAGVMIGRGFFSRPSLAAEWAEGREWSERERAALQFRLHDAIYDYYRAHSEGETQLILKIKPFWDYLQGADRRVVKLLKKATTIRRYEEALAALRTQLLFHCIS